MFKRKNEGFDAAREYGREGNSERILADADLINAGVKQLELFRAYAAADSASAALVEELLRTYKYCSPSADPAVLSIDKRIANELGDLRIEFVKAQKRERYFAVTERLEQLKLLMAERS